MRETNQYSSINFEDRQILSKDAMRSLLDQAIRIKQYKSGEEITRSDVQNAKEYFPHWKKERKIYKKIGLSFLFSLAFAWILYTPEFDLISKLVLFFFFVLWRGTAEYLATKCSYVREILGDTSFLNEEEKQYYSRGLKVEIFNGAEECSFEYLKAFLAIVLLASVIFIAALIPELREQGVGTGAMILFFVNQMSFFKE